jgi:Maltokinase N-terminal cap domain
MALVHQADLRPTKLELLAAWLPGRPWYRGHPGAEIARVAAFRFDDPEGAVGIETMLVGDGDGIIYQVPLTYRGAPTAGGDGWLIGTTYHSVLGQRWVYDACADSVYAATLASAILAGSAQAEEIFEVDGRLERREPSMTVTGSGQDADADIPAIGSVRRVVDNDPTIIVTDSVELAIVRCLNGSTSLPGATLTGIWSGQPTPAPLAYAAAR